MDDVEGYRSSGLSSLSRQRKPPSGNVSYTTGLSPSFQDNHPQAASSSASAGSSTAVTTDTLTSNVSGKNHHHHHHHHHHRRKGRSKSSTRYVDAEKPKKKVLGNASSLMSIPNTVKLSMLNSGFISI
ncbi:unnamed protein product, partial [Allacma fusca]